LNSEQTCYFNIHTGVQQQILRLQSHNNDNQEILAKYNPIMTLNNIVNKPSSDGRRAKNNSVALSLLIAGDGGAKKSGLLTNVGQTGAKYFTR